MPGRRLLFILLFFAMTSAAQTDLRDYSISPPGVGYAADGQSATIAFTVTNQGGDAVEASRIIISFIQSGLIAVEDELPILRAGEARDFAISLPLGDLPTEDVSFRIEAGLDKYELAGSPIARNNEQRFLVNKAEALSGAVSPPDTETPLRLYDLWLPIMNLGFNFLGDGVEVNDSRYSNNDLLLGFGLLLVALFCLWLISLILRLVFRRPPKFEVWQPPYAANSWYDPNSIQGRRQSWQFHAQNSNISAAPVPDQVTVIKRLTDVKGVVLGGWKIKSIRSVQYDIYGRISRSEMVMPLKVITALNRIAQRARTLDSVALRKAIEPIAKRLSKRALSAIEKQNASLWIALDMRFEGPTGEARILFELYQYRDDAWHQIDQWEPELAQVGARLPEHFTFTLNGQFPGESYREFKRRLVEDVTQLLASLFYHQEALEPEVPPAPEAQNTPTTPAEAAWTPADTSGSDDETDAG